MSGPIVRKYGFPNFEAIFGQRELQHGVDEPEEAAPAEATAEGEKEPAKGKAEGKGSRSKKAK